MTKTRSIRIRLTATVLTALASSAAVALNVAAGPSSASSAGAGTTTAASTDSSRSGNSRMGGAEVENLSAAPAEAEAGHGEGFHIHETPTVRYVDGAEAQLESSGVPRIRSTSDAKGDSEKVRTFHRPGESAGQWPSMLDFMVFTVQDAADFWTGTLGQQVRVNYYFPAAGESGLSCGVRITDSTAHYCPSEDLIVVNQQFLRHIWGGTFLGINGERLAPSDMGAAVVIAHEMAHNLQTEFMGWNQNSPVKELHADCLAGAWSGSAALRGLLDDDDAQNAIDAMFLLGDNDGYQTHGRSQQRVDAFWLGYTSPEAKACGAYVPQ